MVHVLPVSFADHAGRLRPSIDAALEAYADLSSGCPARLREAMRYSLLAPGKRLRPMLVLLAAEACGGRIGPAVPAACAVEMVHAYSLIHDDLPAMDDDDLRRGRPTCHKVFGEAIAILAGDALLALALETLASGIRPPEVAVACCATLAQAAGPCQLVGGQADDLAGQRGTGVSKGDSPVFVERKLGQSPGSADANGHLAALESMHGRKTGALIRASLRLGGLTAGADHHQLAALDEYGRRLGLAFQVTDDLLDVRSDEATAGKRVGKDTGRGKFTFPALLGVDQSVAYAERLIGEARDAVATLAPREDGLKALAQHVLERNC